MILFACQVYPSTLFFSNIFIRSSTHIHTLVLDPFSQVEYFPPSGPIGNPPDGSYNPPYEAPPTDNPPYEQQSYNPPYQQWGGWGQDGHRHHHGYGETRLTWGNAADNIWANWGVGRGLKQQQQQGGESINVQVGGVRSGEPSIALMDLT